MFINKFLDHLTIGIKTWTSGRRAKLRPKLSSEPMIDRLQLQLLRVWLVIFQVIFRFHWAKFHDFFFVWQPIIDRLQLQLLLRKPYAIWATLISHARFESVTNRPWSGSDPNRLTTITHHDRAAACRVETSEEEEHTCTTSFLTYLLVVEQPIL
jgi:hypothetical protein